jgi:thioredoxin-like negative regulator of GroEL
MTTTTANFGKLLLAGFLIAFAAAGARTQEPAGAAEVQWRTAYQEARREAVEKNRPLLLDFGTTRCFWCKRLDATTLRDPAIVQLLNGRFIPLKVDAEQESALAQALHIQSYPTLVLAAPDGKILGTQEGYLDATRCADLLQRTLASLTNLKWMTRDYQEAGRAIAGTNYARAIGLLRGVLEDGQARPVQLKARQLLKDLEQQAAGRVARARQLTDKGQAVEALDTLTEVVRVFKGTPAATEAGQLLSTLGSNQDLKAREHAHRAAELLTQARRDYATQQYLCCIDRCELLIASYGDLPEADQARQLYAEIKSNPDWMQTACENLGDRLGTLYLSLAESWMKKGQNEQAVQCLEKVVQAFPGSRQAELAQLRLAQVQGRKAQQANYEKP